MKQEQARLATEAETMLREREENARKLQFEEKQETLYREKQGVDVDWGRRLDCGVLGARH